jgi:pyridoxal phosphate enzyme (YggS family)
MGVRENIQSVRSRIAGALKRSGREAERVTLVTVTKTVDIAKIQEALNVGITHIGENRLQEAEPKIKALKDRSDITWHMIGHLQTNKAKRAIELFQIIHSVDSLRLAKEINKRALQYEKVMDVLLEVNVSGESSKYGLSVEELIPVVQEATLFEGISVKGLMTMAPFVADPEETRPYFRKLREAFMLLKEKGIGRMEYLSMGMTNDFEVAIEEGANIVRIGTAIFGEPEYTATKPRRHEGK